MEVILTIAARKAPGVRARVFRTLADHGVMEEHRILNDTDTGTRFEIRFQWREPSQVGSAAALLYGIDGVVEVHEAPTAQHDFSLSNIVAPPQAPPAETAHIAAVIEPPVEPHRGPRLGFVGLALAGAAIAGGVAYFVIGKQPGGQAAAAPPVPVPAATAAPEPAPVPAPVADPVPAPPVPLPVPAQPAPAAPAAQVVARPPAPVLRPAIPVRPPVAAVAPTPVKAPPRLVALPVATPPAPSEQPLIPAAVPAVQAAEPAAAAVPAPVAAAPAPAPPPATGSRRLVRVQIAPGSNQGR